ncbi:hypothetical protein CKO24_14445 [Rhodothalassium salexigens DSM 2132]|nr:hypothetical protein [Rhodothalassium salexigens DSM 2132]
MTMTDVLNGWRRGLVAAGALMLLAACDGGDGTGGGNGSADAAESGSLPTTVESPGPQATDDQGAATGILVYGSDDAPNTLIEFASWTCGHCGNFYKTVVPQIKEELVATGKLKLMVVDWSSQNFDVLVSSLARCDGPEKFDDYMKLLFTTQRVWLNQNAAEELPKVMRQAGMSRAAYDRCIANRSLQTMIVERAQRQRERFQIEYTPYLVLNGRELKMQPGRSQFEQIKEAVEAASS